MQPAAKIRTTLGEIMDAQDALRRLMEQPLPAQLAYRVSALARRMRSDAEHVIAEREKLFEKFGAERPARDGEIGPMVKEIKAEHTEEFLRKIAELRAVEVEIEARPILLSHLELSDVKMTGIDVFSLGQFLVESPE